MAGNIKGITIQIDGDTSGLNKALKGVNASIRSTQNELRAVEKALKLDPKSTEMLKQKQELLTKAIGDTKDKLETLKEAQRQADEAMQNGEEVNEEGYRQLQREIVLTEEKLKKLQEESKEFGSVGVQRMKAFGESLEKAGAKIEDVGKKMMGVTAAITAMGAASVAAFAEVDHATDIIIKKTGAVGEQSAEMKAIFNDLAGSVMGDFDTIGSGIGEVSTRFQVTGDELRDLSEVFLKFAYINGVDVSNSVDNVQKAMNAFGLETKDAEKLLGVMNLAGQNTGVSMDSLASNLVINATALQELGMDAYQAANFMAQLETSGADSSAVLTGLKKAMYNATQEGKPLSQALSELEDNIKNAKDSTEGLSLAYDIFGSKAGGAIYQALKNGSLSFKDLGNSIGLTDAALQSINSTYDATIDGTDEMKLAGKQLKLALADLGGVIAKTLVPIVQKVTGFVQGLSEKFKSLNPAVQETIVKIALVVAAIGPVIIIIGKIVSGVGTLIKVISSLWAVMMAHPILAVAGALTALAAAFGVFDGMFESGAEEVQVYNAKLKETTDSVLQLNEAMANSKWTYEDNIASIEANAKVCNDLVSELESLAEKENKSAEEKQRMSDICEILNQNVEGSALSYDKETDAITGNIGKTRELIAAKEEEAKKKAAIQFLTDAYQQEYQAKVNLTKAEQEYAYYSDLAAKQTEELGFVVDGTAQDLAAAEQNVKIAGEAVEDASQRTAEASSVVSGAMSDVSESTDEMATASEQNAGKAARVFEWAESEIVGSSNDTASGVKKAFSGINLEKDGENVIAGFMRGIANVLPTLSTRVASVVANVKAQFSGKKGFDENSPSKWAIQTMEYVMEGLAIGAKNGENKVFETVDEIVGEIKKRVGDVTKGLSLQSEKSSLLYELWGLTAGREADEVTKSNRQLESLNEQLDEQGKVVDLLDAELQEVIKQYGGESDASRELENQLLKERIAYEKLAESIREVTAARNEAVEERAKGDAQKDVRDSGWVDRLSQGLNIAKGLASLGYSLEEQRAYAYAYAGANGKAFQFDRSSATASGGEITNVTIQQTITSPVASPSVVRQSVLDGIKQCEIVGVL